MMTRILLLQAGVLLAISMMSALISGAHGFWSALAGGLTYLIPTLIAVLLLRLFQGNPHVQSRMLIAGEVLKIMLSLVFMLIVFVVWHDTLAFLPFFFGLFGVSHLVFLVLLRVKNYGR